MGLPENVTRISEAAGDTPARPAGVDPSTLRPACDRCGQTVLPHRPGTWRQVRGWVQSRGATGGGNHVVDQRPNGVYRCSPCMRLERAGIYPVQQSLM